MKPASIKKFDLFYLAAQVVTVISIVLGYDSLLRQAEAQLAANGLSDLGPSVLIGSIIFGMAINLVIWFVISILRIELFKWILLALTIYGVFSLAVSFTSLSSYGTQTLLATVSTTLSVIALYYLFRPNATAWFAAKYDDGDDDPE